LDLRTLPDDRGVEGGSSGNLQYERLKRTASNIKRLNRGDLVNYPSDPSTIYEDQNTRPNTANVIGAMLPKAFQQPLCLGLYYFEFCDEWWNQPGSPNIYAWWGGTDASGFPNGYWDQEGFGLYSIRRGGNLKNNDPIWKNNGPNTPIDVHRERNELTAKVIETYGAIHPQ
jgi:hypothetical protein